MPQSRQTRYECPSSQIGQPIFLWRQPPKISTRAALKMFLIPFFACFCKAGHARGILITKVMPAQDVDYKVFISGLPGSCARSVQCFATPTRNLYPPLTPAHNRKVEDCQVLLDVLGPNTRLTPSTSSANMRARQSVGRAIRVGAVSRSHQPSRISSSRIPTCATKSTTTSRNRRSKAVCIWKTSLRAAA